MDNRKDEKKETVLVVYDSEDPENVPVSVSQRLYRNQTKSSEAKVMR